MDPNGDLNEGTLFTAQKNRRVCINTQSQAAGSRVAERRPTLVAVFSFPSHVERPNPAGPNPLPHQTASS